MSRPPLDPQSRPGPRPGAPRSPLPRFLTGAATVVLTVLVMNLVAFSQGTTKSQRSANPAPRVPEFVKVGKVYVNLSMATFIVDGPDSATKLPPGTIQVFFGGHDNQSSLNFFQEDAAALREILEHGAAAAAAEPALAKGTRKSKAAGAPAPTPAETKKAAAADPGQ